ncbi:pimeloyl-ACP methyl ester carboxylesterase [Nocardia transvalensis]|uniref:Pimeloyl-ACP methyl ester carboxylesterase n=1 Tax=Nocardia transvalensis TaxID=37333 RepID=A0A7W9PIH2_9NOCA|nr:alpha/beta fold hydrolase [Nocardia transvalensis]MBB5916318.1 pimeloyl-ACP methyl ester carboxylesterase [Nocardia transvalensis]
MPQPSDPARPRRRTVHSGDVRLAVYEYGDPRAETLVLVHGITDTHRVWDQVARMLADSFHVVTYDVRGHGRSTEPARARDYRLDRLTDDLYAVLDAVSPRRPAHVAGHGWGAFQLWDAAADPRAATRIATGTALCSPDLDRLALALREPRLPTAPWWTLPRLGWRVLGRRLLPWPRLRARIRRGTVPLALTWPRDLLAGARIVHANLAHHLRRPRERQTAVPIQLIVDRADATAFPTAARHVRRGADRLWCYRLPADHWLPVTEPLLVGEAIANFIDDRRADNAPIEYTSR